MNQANQGSPRRRVKRVDCLLETTKSIKQIKDDQDRELDVLNCFPEGQLQMPNMFIYRVDLLP